MDYKQLESLNEEFAENSELLLKDFLLLFTEWFKKDPRLTLVMITHLPINMIFKMMSEVENHSVEKAFPELPGCMTRFLSPFTKIQDKWGKISSKEFVEEYGNLYQAQFDKWFLSDKDKNEFEEWYKNKEIDRYNKNIKNKKI